MPPSGWTAAKGGGGGGGGGGGHDRPRGKPGRESAPAAAAFDYDNLTQPCFQAFLRGAWWDVQITQWRSDMFLVAFKDIPNESDAWMTIENLRLKARRCDEWDCPVLIKGVDVSVYDVHPQAEHMSEPIRTKALYDAKISSVAKTNHHGKCSCKFFVSFYAIEDGMSLKHGVDRELVRTVRDKAVNHSSLLLLQQSWMTPLEVLLKGHISENWVEEGHRLTNDAYFLKETELKIPRNSGEESITTPFGEFLNDMSGDDGLPTPDGRMGTAQHCGASKAPIRLPVSGPKTRHGTGWVAAAQKYQTREVNEVDHHRGRNRPLVNNVKYHDRGVKRKHDSVEEKEISNVVQEDYSPGVSSRFPRSKDMVGSGGSRRQQEQFGTSKDMAGSGGLRRQQEQNAGQRMTGIGHESQRHRVEGRMDPKRERRVQRVNLAESEPSEEQGINVLSDSAENVIADADSDHSSERGSTHDVVQKRRRQVEEILPGQTRRHEDRSTQKAPEQVPKSKGYGSTKNEKAQDMAGLQWQMEDTGRGMYYNQREGKRSLAGNNPKLDKAPEEDNSGRRRGSKLDKQPEEENSGRKRGRPRKSSSSECVPRGSPQAMKDNGIRSRHALETENREESPNGFGGSPEIETGRERSSRRDSLGKQDKPPERTSTRRSSERLQKVSPVKLTPPKKKSPEKGGDKNDPPLARTGISLSTSSGNSDEDPANGGSQHRKLRPRVSLKSKKSLPTSKSNRLNRDADKERGSTEKAVDRPLYMDLLVNNDDDEQLCPAIKEEQKPLPKPTWVPPVNEAPSDSDSDCIVEKTPLPQKKWPEFDSVAAPAVPVTVQGNAKPEVRDSDDDLDESKCDHVTIFKDDAGYVCIKCGVVTTPIEDVVPEVEIPKPRPREVDVEEWDLGAFSPEANHAAVVLDQVKNEQVGSMLDVSLPAHYAKQMHPHQKEGFEFLWRNLGFDAQGKLRNKKADRNAGCALSHAPGTGKSFLIIAFLRSYMDKFPNCRPLIVAPKIMLLRWEKEFQRWKSDIRTFILNTALVTGKRILQHHIESKLIDPKTLPMNPKSQVDNCRQALLAEWKRKRSVCLVSYNLFSNLTDGVVSGTEGETVGKALLDNPGILILDEGHFPRNKKTNIRRALMKVKTNARILLSGTLFQNNFEELFNTLYLVRPGFAEAFSSCKLRPSTDMLGRVLREELNDEPLGMEEAENKARKVFVEEIGMKIEEGQLCKGSGGLQHGLQRLQRLTSDFVHHYTGEVLACLPGLRDFGILLKPTALQGALLEVVDKKFQRPDQYLKREIAVSETSIHPKLLTKLVFVRSINVSHELGAHILTKEICDPQDGVKTKFVFDLLSSLRASEHNLAMNEKVLIFSQHISPLDLLEDMFKAAFNWNKNKDVLRLDGKMVLNERETIIEQFNSPKSEAQVLLASTKACGEGINLVGASRVVFLDVLWNPAVIKQAISRAFRLGQKKTVYVYRLIAFGTIEEKKYKKAIQKDWLSMSIFSPVSGEAEVEAERSSDSDKKESKAVEFRAWEVDASNCEDDLLEKLLKEDKSGLNSFLKVVEHGNQFHNRKTACGPDAREWFLEDRLIEDLPETKETEGEEALGVGGTIPEILPQNLYEDFEEIGAFGAGADGSSDTDDEIAYDGQ